MTIAGNDLSLQIDGSIGTMTLQGDRSHVTGGADVSTMVVEGQDNSLAIAKVDDLTIRGQRNSITSTTDLPRLQIAGTNNTVAAAGVGSAEVSGTGNTYPGS